MSLYPSGGTWKKLLSPGGYAHLRSEPALMVGVELEVEGEGREGKELVYIRSEPVGGESFSL